MGNMRDDFESALGAVENEGAEDERTDVTPASDAIGAGGEDSGAGEEEAHGGSGDADKQAEAGHEPKAETTSETASEGSAEVQEGAEKRTDGAEVAEVAAKPPGGWTPTAREAWKDIPKTAQDEITKREREISTALQGSAESRRTAERLNAISAPYSAVMAAEGVSDPLVALESLFKVVSGLRLGTQPQKAAQISQLIKAYGVDIGVLDDTLAGTVSDDPEAAKFEKILDERLKPVDQLVNQFQTGQVQQTQTAQARAAEDIAKFSKNAEFMGDVREYMADALEIAARHGEQLSLPEAYDKACFLHPEISKIMSQRREAQSISSKKAAASSISGRPAGAGGNKSELPLRDMLNQAWDEQRGN